MANMEKDISERIAKSFKKNSWMAKMMFSEDISEIIIERNKYNFEIKICTKDKSVNIPFHYKPNTRKRKRKDSISRIVHNKDSGYDSSNDEKDGNKIGNEMIEKDKNFNNEYINSISMDYDGPIIYRNHFLNIPINNNKYKNNDDIKINVDNIARRKTNIYENKIVEKDKKENINTNINKYKNNSISLNLENEAHCKNDLTNHKKTISFGSLEFNIEKNDVIDNVLFGPREKNTKIIDKYIYIYNLFKKIISNLTILNDMFPPFHYKYSTLQTITSIILNTIIEVDNNLKSIFKINLTHRKNEFQLYIK